MKAKTIYNILRVSEGLKKHLYYSDYSFSSRSIISTILKILNRILVLKINLKNQYLFSLMANFKGSSREGKFKNSGCCEFSL